MSSLLSQYDTRSPTLSREGKVLTRMDPTKEGTMKSAAVYPLLFLKRDTSFTAMNMAPANTD